MAATWVISFSEAVTDHCDKFIYGTTACEGFTREDLDKAAEISQSLGYTTELFDLTTYLPMHTDRTACVLVIRDGVKMFGNYQQLTSELESTIYALDRKTRVRGRVVDRVGSWTASVTEETIRPCVWRGIGTSLSFNDLPCLSTVRQLLPSLLGDKAKDFYANIDYYYDIFSCGIGYHGESEHKKVVTLRLGENVPVHFQWWCNGKLVGEDIPLDIHGNDIYIMDETAVGPDWYRSDIPTLKHAAGCTRYTVRRGAHRQRKR